MIGRKAPSIGVYFLWVTLVQMKTQLEQKPQEVQGCGVGSAGGVKMDNSFLAEQAARCRQLAERSDPFTKRRLLHLAANYEDRLLGKSSRATRRLANLPTELPHAPSALRSDG
jgi:hypothetical protein